MKLLTDNVILSTPTDYYIYLPKIIDNSSSIKTFINSWNNLRLDNYMRDGGTYRYRRYAVFIYDNMNDQIMQKTLQPPYQGISYNALNGGIPRYFDEIENSVTNNIVFQRILFFTVTLCRLINTKVS